MGAAAVDLCSVACGRVDAYFERGLYPWDHVAGALIAREAGAVVGHLDGGPESLDFVLAAPPALHGPLRDLLVAARAAEPWPEPDEVG
jgi:myo-inositol-1(or 4)-monophosphatase